MLFIRYYPSYFYFYLFHPHKKNHLSFIRYQSVFYLLYKNRFTHFCITHFFEWSSTRTSVVSSGLFFPWQVSKWKTPNLGSQMVATIYRFTTVQEKQFTSRKLLYKWVLMEGLIGCLLIPKAAWSTRQSAGCTDSIKRFNNVLTALNTKQCYNYLSEITNNIFAKKFWRTFLVNYQYWK